MSIRIYDTDKDYQEVKNWYDIWGLEAPSQEKVGKIGFIVPEVAAGFLVIASNGTAFLEGFITNPSTWSYERDKALDGIADCLIGMATELGIKDIVCLTKLKAIEERAQKFGFTEVGQYKLLQRGAL